MLLGTPGPALAEERPTIEHQVVHSFDGVPLYSTLFLPPGASAEEPVPLVMRTHGWGGTGETALGDGALGKLVDDGYAVLTRDSRGFGTSGGEAHIDAPNVERWDASSLLDWSAQRPEIEKEAPGDPAIGFSDGLVRGRHPAGHRRVRRADRRHRTRDHQAEPAVLAVPGRGGQARLGEALYGGGLATGLLLGLDPTSETELQAGAYAEEIHRSHADCFSTARRTSRPTGSTGPAAWPTSTSRCRWRFR